MNPTPDLDRLVSNRRSLRVITILTLIGAGLRIWPIGQLGMVHFDEGIYALAGSWVLAPGGLASLSPTLIPYAPPGFVILIGLMGSVLGAMDVSAIVVSVIAGTITIPVVACLAARTFGAGAGIVAATLAASSGPHIAFSRMALTDPLFLLAWLLAFGAGQRFLERPGPMRALVLGLAVGMAQQCKYNGWLAGAVVALAALVGILFQTEERPRARWVRSIGWGLAAAMIAALVVWPWYQFVEHHGGYADLLRHQRSYLGGVDAWWPHFRTQLEQGNALSGGWKLALAAGVIATFGVRLTRITPGQQSPSSRIKEWGSVFGSILCFVVFANTSWWLGLGLLPILFRSQRPAMRMLGVAWAVLAVLTPFYHPYARLWLPIHALGWIAAGGVFASFTKPTISRWDWLGPVTDRLKGNRIGRRSWYVWLFVIFAGLVWSHARLTWQAQPLPGLFARSDSVRQATADLAARIPEEVTTVRLLARPPVTFYLGGKVAIWPQSGLEQLARPSDPRIWAIYDSGLASTPGLGETLPESLQDGWDVVNSAPTTLSMPTLLDIDPGAARSVDGAIRRRRAPLWLLRPKRAGGRQ